MLLVKVKKKWIDQTLFAKENVIFGFEELLWLLLVRLERGLFKLSKLLKEEKFWCIWLFVLISLGSWL